jgi:hypothetical protein
VSGRYFTVLCGRSSLQNTRNVSTPLLHTGALRNGVGNRTQVCAELFKSSNVLVSTLNHYPILASSRSDSEIYSFLAT